MVRAVNDLDLVDAFRRGESDAFRFIYDEFGRLVYSIAYHVLREKTLAEEALQLTFVRAWENSGTFAEGRSLGPWLAVVAKRVAIDVWRRERRRSHETLDELTSFPDPESVGDVEDVWAIRSALASLDDNTRSLLELQYRDGFSQREVAEQLDIPVGTVKSRTHAAQARLATALRREHVTHPSINVQKTKRNQQ
jgi:RNA polymerase sigma-70 factor, ECF subfamily